MTRPGELCIIYTHRPPVSITGEDPIALYNYLHTPTQLRYSEFKRAIVTSFEDTQLAG